MMFIIKQKDINDKLQNICSVVDNKLSSDIMDNILDCVLFEVSPKELKLTASSIDIQVSTTIEGDFGETSYSFTINARNIADIVRNLSSILDIKFEIEENTVHISSGKSKFSLPNRQSSQYPILNVKEVTPIFELPSKQLQKALQGVSFSMGTHHLRYFLSGCMIRAAKGKIVFVSTDTHRLSFYHIELESIKDANDSMILPKKALMYIDKTLSTATENAKVSKSSDEFFIVETDQFIVTAKLIVGAYPEYERVFSQEMTQHAICDTQLLRESLQRVAVLATDKFKTVRFNFNKNELVIDTKSTTVETARTEMELDYQGEEISFNFNAGYFSDLLNRFDEKKTKFSFIDDRASVEITFEGNESFKYVLMPLRV